MSTIRNSVIKLYKSEITPVKNCICEDIHYYLNDLDNTLTINDFQYIKHDLEIKIKLNGDLYTEQITKYQYNFLSITNGDYNTTPATTELTYYYFIRAIEYISPSCVSLTLNLDTLNTFNGLYTFSDKTKIIREHRDRYEAISGVNYPRVDKESEGVEVVKQYREDSGKGKFLIETYPSTYEEARFYLIYRSQNVATSDKPSGIDVLLTSDKALPINSITIAPFDISFVNGTLQDGLSYWFTSEDNPDSEGCSFTINGTTYDFNNGSHWRKVYEIYKVDSVHYALDTYLYDSNTSLYVHNHFLIAHTYPITLNKVFKARVATTTTISSYRYSNIQNIINVEQFNSGVTFSALKAISELDRYDNKLIKIIELPYPPTALSYNEGGSYFDFSSFGELSTDGFILIKDLNYNNSFNIVSNDDTFSLPTLPALRRYSDLRNDSLETKIYNSSFTSLKYVYDSFSYELKMESFRKFQNKINIDFYPSRNMNSNFLFKFTPLCIDKVSYIDYENILIVKRNNESPIYNSDYLNYIKNGYNFDKKKYAEQEKTSIAKGVIGTIASVAGIIVGGATGNVPLLGASIALGATTTKGIIDNVSNHYQHELSLSEKLNQLKEQANSVAGSDDLDLLNIYNGNKLEWRKYEPTPVMKEALLDLFYYCGYAHQVQELPVINSRYWFNYLQCEPIFTNEGDRRFSKYIEDIKNRYSLGVTYYHYKGGYNFAQDRENWEEWLVNG